MPALSCAGVTKHQAAAVLTVLFGAAMVVAAEQSSNVVVATPPGAQQPPAQTQPAGPPPKFRCDEMEFDFGTVWAMDKVEHAFIIHNDGEGPLTIDAKPTCGCTIAEFDKTIAPHGEGKVKTILSTGNYSATLHKSIVTTTNDPEHKQVNLTLKGTVKTRVSSEPMLGAYFGTYTPEMNLTKVFKLTNNTDKIMKIEVVPPNPPSAAFKCTVKEVEAGKTAEVTVEAVPPFKDDVNSAQFTLKTGIENVADLVLPCSIVKPPTLQVLPPVLRLPTTPLVNVFKQPLKVQNNGEAPIKLISAESNDPRIKVTTTEDLAGKRYTVNLEVPAGFEADPNRSPVLTITTDYSQKPVFTVPLLAMPTPRLPVTQLTAEQLVGRPAPSMTLATAEGQQVRIGSGTNQVMLLNFWSSWCTSSRTQIPKLDELYQVYRRKGVEFVNVNVEQLQPAGEIMKVVKDLDSKIPVGLDSTRAVAKAYGVNQFPMVVLVGKTGNIEAVRRGIGRNAAEADTAFEAIAEQLDKLLEGKTRAEFTPKPLFVGLTCALEGTRQPPSAPNGPPMLYLETLRYDAGSFKPDTQGECMVYFRNAGGQPLDIRNLNTPNGLKVDPSYPKSVAAGTTAAFKCSFATPAKPEGFAFQLGIESNDPSQPILNLAVVGQSKPYVEVQPASGVDFYNKVRTFSVPRIATLVYNGEGNVEYKNAKSSSPKFEAEVKQGRVPNIAIVTVKALPPFDPGVYEATINIETSVTQQPTVQVPVKLVMPKRIEVQPAEIRLGRPTSIQQFSIVLTNSGDSDLSILGITKSKPEIQTQFFPETDGKSYKLQVTIPAGFAVSPEGDKITIRTSDKEFGEIVVPLTSVFAGRAPISPRAQ